MILDVNNFIQPYKYGDKIITILNMSGDAILYIDPYSSEFFRKNNRIHIVVDGIIDPVNVIEFSLNSDAELGLNKLNDAKAFLTAPPDTVTVQDTIIHGSLIPEIDEIDLGSAEHPWRHIFVSGSTIYMNGNEISSVGEELLLNGDVLITNSALTDGYYDKVYIDTISSCSVSGLTNLSAYTYSLGADLSNHEADSSIHYTKSDIFLGELGNVIDASAVTGQILMYNTDHWENTSPVMFYTTGETYSSAEVDGILDSYISNSGGTIHGNIILDNLSGSGLTSTDIDDNGLLTRGNTTRLVKSITGSTLIDQFNLELDFAVKWDYTIRKGVSNVKAGTITACWDQYHKTVQHSSISTTDIGDTSNLRFLVDIFGYNVRLIAVCSVPTESWELRVVRSFL